MKNFINVFLILSWQFKITNLKFGDSTDPKLSTKVNKCTFYIKRGLLQWKSLESPSIFKYAIPLFSDTKLESYHFPSFHVKYPKQVNKSHGNRTKLVLVSWNSIMITATFPVPRRTQKFSFTYKYCFINCLGNKPSYVENQFSFVLYWTRNEILFQGKLYEKSLLVFSVFNKFLCHASLYL